MRNQADDEFDDGLASQALQTQKDQRQRNLARAMMAMPQRAPETYNAGQTNWGSGGNAAQGEADLAASMQAMQASHWSPRAIAQAMAHPGYDSGMGGGDNVSGNGISQHLGLGQSSGADIMSDHGLGGLMTPGTGIYNRVGSQSANPFTRFDQSGFTYNGRPLIPAAGPGATTNGLGPDVPRAPVSPLGDEEGNVGAGPLPAGGPAQNSPNVPRPSVGGVSVGDIPQTISPNDPFAADRHWYDHGAGRLADSILGAAVPAYGLYRLGRGIVNGYRRRHPRGGG